MVGWSEIEQNDYNLNIPRYIQPRYTEIEHDIEAHLHGELPAHDIELMDDYWAACPSLRGDLFEENTIGYYSLKPTKDEISSTIEQDPSCMSLGEVFPSDPKEWAEEVKPKLLAVCHGASFQQ